MKKLLIVLFLLLAPVFSFAQQGGNKTSDLGNLTLRFCNDTSVEGGTKALQMSAKPGEEKEICILLNNDGPTPLKISLNFVDGSSTSDLDAKKACQPEETKTYFGQYIQAEDTGFLVNPKQTIKTIVKAKFPEGYAGMAYGCATFQVMDSQVDNTGMFKVIARRANFVDIFVDGKIKVGLGFTGEDNPSIINISDSKDLVLYDNIVKQTLVSKVNIYNSGNIGVTGNINASYNYLLFLGANFEAQKFRVMPKLTMPYEFDLPWYVKYIGGPVVIKYNVDYTPEIFGPDTQGVVKVYSTSIQSSAFLMPRRILIIIAIIIIYKISKKMRNRNKDKNIANRNETIQKSDKQF